MKRPFPGIGWLTLISLAAVVAVNAAGFWAISSARDGLSREARRLFESRTHAQAAALQGLLTSARVDLAFLSGSQPMADLPAGLQSADPALARFRRLAVEGAVLLFLRAHPELSRIAIQGEDGSPLVQAGRRGGVPVLWRPAATGAPEAERPADPSAPALVASTTVTQPGSAVVLTATLDPHALLARARPASEARGGCLIRDAGGRLLAQLAEGGEAHAPAAAGDGRATASIEAEGWQLPSPWQLECVRSDSPADSLDPLAARFRATLWLNLAVLGLTLLLGYFAIDQGRRRERLEARAREEARVREMERQLFHSERLGTVGRMAASMAHEINNPLEGIANYLSLVQEAAARDDREGALRYLSRARDGLSRATDVLRRVLQHADPATSPRAPVDLNEALESAVGFVRTSGSFPGIEFSLSLHQPSPRVMGDPVTLGQLFLNLAINACEAQPAGGRVRVGVEAAGDTATVSIADDGPGISAADAERIFEPFFSTKGSTGLGLSICRSIVTQHGGEIRAVSGRGPGATFIMTFPAAPLIP